MRTIEEISVNYTPYIKGEMKLFRQELEKEGYKIVFFSTFTNEYACKQSYIEYIDENGDINSEEVFWG